MSRKKSYAADAVQYYWQHAWRYRRYVIPLGFALPITTLVNQILPPLVLASVLNKLSKHQYVPHDVWGSFGPILIVYGVLVLVGGTVTWRVVDYFVWRLESRVSKDMAEEVFAHLTAQSADFHANHFGGSLVSQTNKLLGGYIRVQDTTLFQIAPLIFGLIFSVIVLSRYSPLFAFILVAFAIVYATTALFVTRFARRLASRHAAFESKQTGLLADAITNVMTIKSFAGSAFEKKRYARATEETRRSLIDFSIVHRRQQIYFGTLLSTISATSLTMAVISVVIFDANIAAVFLIFNYTSSIAEQLFQFSNSALRSYNRALGDAGDMMKILEHNPSITDPENPEPSRIRNGKIEFQSVSFQHDGSDDALFKKLSLSINPGEKVGLVGHSGSGKTTFTRLLLRFSDIQSGEIAIDGQNIAHLRQDDLRRHIAYVPQEPMMFHRSIRENISYGDPSANRQSIEAVAKLAHAHEFISTLPQGYDTLVGERGVKLSGGQRQRVAIARAIIKNAPILVLDEATSALDSESEILIQDALWKLMEGRTAIVIAHRLSTIQKMDRIVVMDNGKVVEMGSHKELLNKKNGTYAKLWAHQSGGFIEE